MYTYASFVNKVALVRHLCAVTRLQVKPSGARYHVSKLLLAVNKPVLVLLMYPITPLVIQQRSQKLTRQPTYVKHSHDHTQWYGLWQHMHFAIIIDKHTMVHTHKQTLAQPAERAHAFRGDQRVPAGRGVCHARCAPTPPASTA